MRFTGPLPLSNGSVPSAISNRDFWMRCTSLLNDGGFLGPASRGIRIAICYIESGSAMDQAIDTDSADLSEYLAFQDLKVVSEHISFPEESLCDFRAHPDGARQHRR